jgi:hypothetical protein
MPEKPTTAAGYPPDQVVRVGLYRNANHQRRRPSHELC